MRVLSFAAIVQWTRRRFNAALAASVAAGCGGGSDSGSGAPVPRSLAQQLVDEFEGAYPDEVDPSGRIHELEIVAEPTEVRLGDGPPLRVWAYNGSVPGPTVRIRLGDTLRAHFVNRLPDETTIHWHGVRVPNAMDGVPHVTQPPVRPGERFVYEFTPKDAGTYWFHPHVRGSEQVERGLHAVLIVDDPQPLPYSRDVMWVIDDWRLDPSRQIDGNFNTRHDLAHDGRWGNVRTINGRTDEILRVRPGERIRLRMLNCANGRIIAPHFGSLRPRIIAVDGKYLREAIPLQRFEMAPGNRLDLDIVVDQRVSELLPVLDVFSSRGSVPIASIAVDGPPVETPDFASPAGAHIPRWERGLSAPVHHDYRMNARLGGPHGIEWTFDNQAMRHEHGHAHEPSLAFTRGLFHRIRFSNESARLHPIHMHGMFFRLLARNGQPIDEPFFRDTVLVHGRESVDLGVVPTDIGQWMVHCHILEHAESGMMTLVEVRDAVA
jgi:FtsP/CotA-like multicopper oxidase with cupredoxin domain